MGTLGLCRAVAAVTAVSIVAQPHALIIVALFERGGTGTLLALMLLAVLAMAVVSIIGLWRCRWWGFLAFYGYGITATILLGTALIPFVMALAPAEGRVESLIALNAVSLLAVGYLQWRHVRPAPTRP